VAGAFGSTELVAINCNGAATGLMFSRETLQQLNEAMLSGDDSVLQRNVSDQGSLKSDVSDSTG
jgi:hypothetical protein